MPIDINQDKVTATKAHNVGVDCLRCFLMYLIVVHHVSLYSVLGEYRFVALVFLISMMAVDGFIGISGWYGVRFGWRKVLSIGGQIIYYAILNSLLSIVLYNLGYLKCRHIGIGNAWYGICYLALIFMAPLINAGIDGLAKAEKKWWMFGLLFIPLIVDYFSRCIGLGFAVGGFGSHTFITFFYVYLFVRLYRVLKWNIRREFLLLAFVGYVGLFLVLHLMGGAKTLMDTVTPWGWYNCPLVILSSFLILGLFININVPRWASRICAFLVPSVFSIYLLHDVSSVGKEFLVGKMASVVVGLCGSLNALGSLVLCLFVSALIFMFAAVVDVVLRRLPLLLIRRVIVRSHGY